MKTGIKQTNEKMIKIGVLSDTHISDACSPVLPKAILNGLKGVDFIIHAGDIVNMNVLKDLEKIAPVYAVSGNMDGEKTKRLLPRKKIMKFGRFKIGLTHGYGSAANIALRVRKEFSRVDIIIFGHSHELFNEIIDGVLMFNPGSAAGKNFEGAGSYGIIELGKKITAKHVEI